MSDMRPERNSARHRAVAREADDALAQTFKERDAAWDNNAALRKVNAEQAEAIARLRAALQAIEETQPNNDPVVWAIVMKAHDALALVRAPGPPA